MKLSRKTWLAVATVPLVGLSAGPPAATAGASTPGAAAARPGAVMPRATGATSKVIVLLRDTASRFAPHTSSYGSAVRTEEAPVVTSLRAAGASVVSAGRGIPYVVAKVTRAQQAALAADPAVQYVMRDVRIPAPTPEIPEPLVGGAHGSTSATRSPKIAPSICGTASKPEQDPEALSAINAPAAWKLGIDGANVSVAYIAGGIDPTIADFQRNAKYATSSSPTGSGVVTPVNFSGDPAADQGGDAATESFLDASSIAAQGNTVFDLGKFISSSHTLPSSPCDITITGAAPGANVTGLDVFSNDYDTTESNFIQAIDYAVTHGVLVLNESFGANNFPDTALDATRIADDDATAAGVTVVVSSGDAGVTSTMGSPATDPLLIAAGASTTFRLYAQDFFGGINATVPNANNGTWIDNNISSLSSGGFAMDGKTVDLVAPGDLNWVLCSTGASFVPPKGLCTDENGNPSPIALSGGTSESAPLTSAAAADVIQAYSNTHGRKLPSPALVKQILMSTATDISAPADQQGAGLLNIGAAVKLAESVKSSSSSRPGGLLVSPNQIDIQQAPHATTSKSVSLTNTGTKAVTVALSTRALTKQFSSSTGSFCLNPTSSSISCGPPTTNTFQIWSGVTEVYQEETFTVPSGASSPSRLNFSADYQYSNQSSLLHVALLDPTGAYAGYSLPQGLADYANIQVANPKPGTWTAIFFTEQGSGNTGTSGPIQWRAITSEFAPAGAISPSSLHIPAGSTKTATFSATSPGLAGDTAQSIVVKSGSTQTTIPVAVRTTVPIGKNGGTFKGVLTGGNGRGNPAQTTTYVFTVPKGERDIDVSAKFGDANDAVNAFLVDPQGETVGSSSSLTFTGSIGSTDSVNVYRDAPAAGQWMLVLDWLQPVSGSELSLPFSGAIRFNQVSISSNLPNSDTIGLRLGKTYTYKVKIKNTGISAEQFFADPRSSKNATYRLPDQNGSDQDMQLPLPASLSFPLYIVPNDTTKLVTSIVGSQPVTYDIEPWTGDPDLSPMLAAPGAQTTQGLFTASLNFSASAGVFPGLWYLNPSEIGSYGPAGAQPATASATFKAVTPRFDTNITSTTGDLWAEYQGLESPSDFNPLAIQPGQTATITLTIAPTGKAGSHVSGSVKVDDVFQANVLSPATVYGSADELTSLPFKYTVCPATGTCP